VVISHDRNNIRQLMWDLVGIVRNDFRLSRALRHLTLIRDEVEKYYRRTKVSPELIELRNLATVAWLIVLSARHRKESRGLHYNTDYPETDDAYWKHDTVIKDGEILI
jgi:L-aspartate oxidase